MIKILLWRLHHNYIVNICECIRYLPSEKVCLSNNMEPRQVGSKIYIHTSFRHSHVWMWHWNRGKPPLLKEEIEFCTLPWSFCPYQLQISDNPMSWCNKQMFSYIVLITAFPDRFRHSRLMHHEQAVFKLLSSIELHFSCLEGTSLKLYIY